MRELYDSSFIADMVREYRTGSIWTKRLYWILVVLNVWAICMVAVYSS